MNFPESGVIWRMGEKNDTVYYMYMIRGFPAIFMCREASALQRKFTSTVHLTSIKPSEDEPCSFHVMEQKVIKSCVHRNLP